MFKFPQKFILLFQKKGDQSKNAFISEQEYT